MPEVPPFLLDALRFQNPRTETLRGVPDAAWQQVLNHWHTARLVLPLRSVCGDQLPLWVAERLDKSIAKTQTRFERIKFAYTRVATTLLNNDISSVVVKGFSLWPDYSEHPKYRPQSDIDLYIPPQRIFAGRDCLLSLGYESHPSLGKQISLEHLPALVPRNSWAWKGDNFDPEIPISFELHFSWWNQPATRIAPEGLEGFWPRRETREIDGMRFTGLSGIDNLAYTALNVLRTILKGYPPPEQLYSLSCFLHLRADDDAFWKHWQSSHPESLRSLQAIAFCVAREWFACRLSDRAQEEVHRLPSHVHRFVAHFSEASRSPRYGALKDGLWLHLDLLPSHKDKLVVFLERTVPIRARTIRQVLGDDPPPRKLVVQKDATHVSRHSKSTWGNAAVFFVSRSAHHLRVFPLTLARGLRYLFLRRNLSPQFWTFFAASFCFDFGMTMYFFLYNVYLLDRGFKEDFLGWMLSAMNIGSIACTIPAGILVQRVGLRKSLLFCISTLSVVLAARALFAPQSAILGLALLGGFLTTIWAVAISPAIAQFTEEESRPFGFSVVFSSGIGLGILANIAASRLPALLTRVDRTLPEMRSKQIVLLASAAIVAFALVPLSRLRTTTSPPSQKKIYPWNPFLLRFLPALALWSVVTGSLSPLANVYFLQYLHAPLSQVGTIFSFSSLLQVLGILIAPLIFRKLGIVNGIASTQLVAAMLLGFLAVTTSGLPAAFLYVGFTGFLWMCEPGLFSLLMSSVPQEQRAGASALEFFVISLVQAGTVAATGSSIAHFGYPKVLGATAIIAAIAAMAFRVLLEPRHPLPSMNTVAAPAATEQ